MKNFQQMMQMGQKMQARMEEMKEKLAEMEVTARAGGGMVEVTANGEGEITDVSLDPEIVDPEDVEMLEDLVLSAVSEAQRRADEKREEAMKEVTGGLPMDGLGDLGGLSGLLG
ncbi:MAG: YbaB/EbfC family nucleoid-associated protein [Gemmatimonadota bacterium]